MDTRIHTHKHTYIQKVDRTVASLERSPLLAASNAVALKNEANSASHWKHGVLIFVAENITALDGNEKLTHADSVESLTVDIKTPRRISVHCVYQSHRALSNHLDINQTNGRQNAEIFAADWNAWHKVSQ